MRLNLSNNKITDISIFEKVNFKKLKELDLNDNDISDISILEKVNFKELNILNLSSNKINQQINSSLIRKLISIIKNVSI